MMFVFGMIVPIALCVIVYASYAVGYKQGKSCKKEFDLSREEKKKIEEAEKKVEGINKVMAYSVEHAHAKYRG